MGARASGALSDYVFYKLSECNFIQNQSSQHLDIITYWRFKDDIFAILQSFRTGRLMYDTLVQRASACYVVERDECSMVGAAFLDAYVFKPENFQFHGKLEWRPHIKPTARHFQSSYEYSCLVANC